MSDVGTKDKPETKFDAEAFAMNVARAMESSGQALAAYLKPRQAGEVKDKPPNEIVEVVKTFSSVAEYWMSDKDRATDLQHKMGKAYLDLWGSAMRRMAGEEDVKPAAEMPVPTPSLASTLTVKAVRWCSVLREVICGRLRRSSSASRMGMQITPLV